MLVYLTVEPYSILVKIDRNSDSKTAKETHKMRHHVFNLTPDRFSYLFSVDATDSDQLARLLIAKWTLSNETHFLEKATSSPDAATVLKNLTTYMSNSTANCLIVSDTDSCFKTFEDTIAEQGGIHLFKPMGWNVPPMSELVLLKNKHSSLVDLYYHPSSETVWMQFSKTNYTGMIKLNDPEVIKEYAVIGQVGAMGL